MSWVSVSPRAVEGVGGAVESGVELQGVGSGGGEGAGDGAGGVGRVEPDSAVAAVGLFALAGVVGVGVDDGGLDYFGEASPGQRVGVFGDPPVHHGHGLVGDVAGVGGDLASDPGFDLTGLDAGPESGEAVAQVEGVADEPGGGVGGDGEFGAEFGGAELRHLRSAVAAEWEHLFGSG